MRIFSKKKTEKTELKLFPLRQYEGLKIVAGKSEEKEVVPIWEDKRLIKG